jgi:molybdopterin/thiamine biosynthesis adenylyltransferase
MALAPYFDKTALAAATVLRGFDRDGFTATLERHVIAIVFDDRASLTAEGRVALELSVNVCARLYPKMALSALGDEAAQLKPQMEALSRSINPNIELVAVSAATVCLIVGDTRAKVAVPTIYVGSDGWIVRVSQAGPVGCGATANPFGAAAAACFGAANVFRSVFNDQLYGANLDRSFQMSLLDFDPEDPEPSNPEMRAVTLREAHLVGAGAIGNGALWALARFPGVRGTLNIVDGERIDFTNSQRYVLTRPDDENTWKVELAQREFLRLGSRVVIRPHGMRWGRYLASYPRPWRLNYVAVALDSARDRIAVQAALPTKIVNAWTQAGDLGISRHEFLGNGACLACLYLPDGPAKNEDQLVAEAIGLTGQEMEIRKLLYTGEPIGADLLQQIAAALGVSVEPLLPFSHRPLRSFYSEAVCGGIVMQLQENSQQAATGDSSTSASGKGRPRQGTEVPMVFQSALAGVLLASDMVADAAGLSGPTGTKTVIDLLKPLGIYLTVPTAKHPSGRCICQDTDYLRAFKASHVPVPEEKLDQVATPELVVND